MKVGSIRVTFAFMKATEGTWTKDPNLNGTSKGAREAGIIRGAYHFSFPISVSKTRSAI
ncbi:MAG: hypothetical protein IPH31_21555 [Lewinellaceae bacterium]|nr:hypothetical protein [Lewinellaceae bacterium]